MKLQGEYRLAYPRQTVWEALMDPAVLAGTLPGCQRLERVDAQTFRGALQVAIGPVKGAFTGTLALTDVEPPTSYRMRLDGSGPAGFMKGEGLVVLEEDAGGTLLRYDLDAQVGGRVAGVGQRLLDSSARSIARQGLEGLERQLAARAPSATADRVASGVVASAPAPDAPATDVAPSRAAAAPPPPGAAGMAMRVARDVAGDLVPPPNRPALVISLVALVVSLVALVVALAR